MTTGLPTYDVSSLSKGLRTEVKGTYYYPDALQAMMKAHSGRQNSDFTAEVTIVPEPDNPHSASGNTLSVRWRDRVIGHIPSELSGNFQQLRRIAASGFDPSTLASVWVSKDYENQWRFDASVQLGAPDLLVPLNDPPVDGFAVLPSGNAIQVTKESDHIDVLADYVPPSGEGHLLVTLHVVEAGIRAKWEGIEVRLGGERIGELTKASSEKYVPAVRHFDDLGLLTVAHATIKGSSLAAEVTLHAARSSELSESQLSPIEYAPIPRLVDFEENPRNYPVADRWPGESTQRQNRPPSQSFSMPLHTLARPAPLDWGELLAPDGARRANLFQRGVVRARVRTASADNSAPRIDYATVGQCERIMQAHGGDPARVREFSGPLLMGLWWVLLVLLAIVALIGLVTAPVGLIFTALAVGPFVYHYITRARLQPPFDKQQK
ncbi:hypothetical protein EAH68_12655 [Corynebacterium hylobatis]|uniref:HIRAN domain-containing protein n=1 Tax=Corynebacterium hylobatis TaxID=1859290 RepID=A0A430HV94_9CORY|nr:HIRAN domain-containing protein [Corynebacterium hylobatis]RSZ61510.1 hypothetical protein EAH68_12655 [Corynebacterium hylobatis]